MKMKVIAKHCLLCVAVLGLNVLLYASQVDWQSVNGGGTERSSVSYKIYDSIGQAVSGDISGTTYKVSPSGFVLPLPAVPPAPWTTTYNQGISMISIPLQPDNSSLASLVGAGFVDMAKWTTSGYSYYSQNPSDSFLALSPGQGYWVKLSSQSQISVTGTAVSENTDYIIPLSQGWNQVGNPFTFNVSFSNVKAKYSGNTKTLSEAVGLEWIKYIYSYPNASSGYQTIATKATGVSGTLEPWLGYWVYCPNALDLLIPPTKTAKAKEQIVIASGTLRLKINATAGNITRSILVGKSSQSELIPLPPSAIQEDVLEIYSVKGNEKYLGEFNDSLNYEFVVLAKSGENVTLSIEKNILPADYYLSLTDAQMNKEFNITDIPYTFTADGTDRKLKLQITKASNELFSQNITLDDVKIYPTPIKGNLNISSSVNITAKLSTGLPMSGEIEIYTVSGKLIAKEQMGIEYMGKGKVKLSSQNVEAAILDLPSGVYIARITLKNALGQEVSKVLKIPVVK